ncbi:hypothetical protein [Methylovirgula sp. 4M-Z18]|uniref:hypothetical protein n=1 Tax=Methylovirgula sp. 4M-Z18 TaxID=2293567 RepID=UPI000E2F2FF0|nr:hypothetical protein [Methylovirgula sp. 4M-Z18]RFB78889.1 hypothetical protein DYH55_13720 [Methylovirgula sp. 4M-Z18]
MISQRLKTSSAAALLVAVLGAASIAQVVFDASNATAATTNGRGSDGGSRGGNAGPSGPSGGDSNGGTAGGSHDGGSAVNIDCTRDRCPPRRPMRIMVERPMSDRCLMPERLVYDAWGRPFYVYCNARSQRPYYTE